MMTDSQSKVIDVRMTEMRVSTNDHALRSSGIGSCMVITIYDPVRRIGAMAHPMLPAATLGNSVERIVDSDNKTLKPKRYSLNTSLRFIEPAIDAMIKELEKLGAVKSRLESKLVGGANMFRVFDNNPESIGLQNAEAAKAKLEKEGIKIIANDTGGNAGRSVLFDLTTGVVDVKTKI